MQQEDSYPSSYVAPVILPELCINVFPTITSIRNISYLILSYWWCPCIFFQQHYYSMAPMSNQCFHQCHTCNNDNGTNTKAIFSPEPWCKFWKWHKCLTIILTSSTGATCKVTQMPIFSQWCPCPIPIPMVETFSLADMSKDTKCQIGYIDCGVNLIDGEFYKNEYSSLTIRRRSWN